jgi:hypothetical protein
VVLALIDGGARLLGGGVVQTESGNREVFVRLSLRDGSEEILPALVAKLSNLCMFRTRDAALVSTLRLRALEWCKAQGLGHEASLLVPGSVALAVRVSSPERNATAAMDMDGPKSSWWKTSS